MDNPIFITGCARSGIYEIVCSITEKRYIGSSVNIKSRCSSHIKNLRNNTHDNSYLQNAFNKYGEKTFSFNSLHLCKPGDLLKQEQRYLDKLKTYKEEKGYNICEVAGSRLGTKFSKESRKRLSISRKGKYVGEDNHNHGKPMLESIRKKISNSLKGRFAGKDSPCYGSKHSAETKRKISKAGRGRVAWNKGLTKDDPRVKKYSDSQIGKVIAQEIRNKISNKVSKSLIGNIRRLGTKHSIETRKKMSESQRERWGQVA